jgi:DNA-entry nuclease
MSRRRRNKINLKYTQVFIILLLIGYIVGYVLYPTEMDYLFEYDINSHITTETIESGISSNIPDYSGSAYIILDDNIPNFETDLINTNSFEEYSDLDSLGRCGVALANISTDLMPTESRGTIGSVKPTGWHTIKYDIVDGKYLYNRCHLIGYQLTGENANNKNLITCTRQMNVGAMLDFENEVTNYIKKTNNHVLYRVTPIFEGSNLVAKGVQMEALSVEDNGEGIKFNVFVYNVQNGIEIDYSNGDSKLAN